MDTYSTLKDLRSQVEALQEAVAKHEQAISQLRNIAIDGQLKPEGEGKGKRKRGDNRGEKEIG